ncbi:MAG: methylmalonyl-CoA epimerase [Candidatus Marinimicrobia bacterium]|nr:methylmalonyl-CoA epimerase [Candidatus Neomarinimicrobiota bacterium]
MKIKAIEHIGIAVENAGQSSPFWNHLLGIKKTGHEVVEEQGVSTVIFDTGRGKIELLEALSEDSAIAKYITKKGAGIHHICLEVDDIETAITDLQSAGVNLIYDQPQVGAEGMLITFVHPRSAGGVLVELAQKPV